MKHTFKEIFNSPKFVVGFSILMAIILLVIFYPLFVTADPLQIIGLGTFFEPGIYVNVFDSLGTRQYTLNLDDAAQNRLEAKLGEQERQDIKEWLVLFGIPEDEIDTEDTEALLTLWEHTYDPTIRFEGMTSARRKYFVRLDAALEGVLSTVTARTWTRSTRGA